MSSLTDLTGKTFGSWLVLRRAETRSHNVKWVCFCVCKSIREVNGSSLKSGDSLSCGCKYALRTYENLYNILVSSVKSHRKQTVDLTYEEFLEFTKETMCHYCGVEVFWSGINTRKTKRAAYNLDRKDGEFRYIKDNLVVCCKRCNWAKNSHFTYEEWKLIGNVIRSWREQT